MPPKRRLVELSACVNSSKIAKSLLAGMPVSETVKCKMAASFTTELQLHPQHHFSFFGKLNGIAGQVGDNLPERCITPMKLSE